METKIKASSTITPNLSKEVLSTREYSIFKLLGGNRVVNLMNLRRIKASMNEKYLLNPILVNEKMEIIDGQHRFLSAKELGLPINYIIVHGYGLREVQMLNTNTKNWTKLDYLESYCELKVPEYLMFKKFMYDFPDFGVQVCESLLTFTSQGTNTTQKFNENGKRYMGTVKSFEEGKLQISNIGKSYDYAEKVMNFQKYYTGYNRFTFVKALLAIFENPEYVHKEMLTKLEMQSTKLVNCVNIEQYRVLLENIYNWKRKDRANFRF